jgi:hypothetical protein
MQKDQKSQPPAVAVSTNNTNAFRQWVQRAIDLKNASRLLVIWRNNIPQLFETGHALFTDAEHKIDLRADWVSAVDALCLALQDWMEDASTAKAECAALRAGDLLAFFLFRAAVQTLAVLDAVDSQRAHAKRIRDAWEQIERVWSARGVLFHHQLVRNLPSVLQQMQDHGQRAVSAYTDNQPILDSLIKEHAEYLQLPEEKRRSMPFPVSGSRPELQDVKFFLELAFPHVLSANHFKSHVAAFFDFATGINGGYIDNYFIFDNDGKRDGFHAGRAARWVESIGAVSALGIPRRIMQELQLDALNAATHANLVDDKHITMATLAPDLYVCIRRAWALAAPQPLPVAPAPTKMRGPVAEVDIDGKKRSAYIKFGGISPGNNTVSKIPTYLLFPLGRDAHTQLGALRQKLQELTPAAYRSFFSLYESGGAAPREPKTLLETLADDAMEALRKNPADELAHARMDAVQNYLQAARDVEEAWRKDGLDLSDPDPKAGLSTLRNAVYLAGPFLDVFFYAQRQLLLGYPTNIFDGLFRAREQLVQLYWTTRARDLGRLVRRIVPWTDKEEAAWTALEQKAAATKGPVEWADVAATISLDGKQPEYQVARAAFGLPLPGTSLMLLEKVGESNSFRTHWIELGLWAPSMRVAPDTNNTSIYHFTQVASSSTPYFERLAQFHPGFLYAVTRGRGVNKKVPVAAESKDSYEQWWLRAATWLHNQTKRNFLERKWPDPYADYTNDRLERLHDRLRMYKAQIELQKMHGISKDLTSIIEGYAYPLQGGWTGAWTERFARNSPKSKMRLRVWGSDAGAPFQFGGR